MKHLLVFISFLYLALSCTEVPVGINPSGGDNNGENTDLKTQLQNVLIEEFTGVQCVNCPAGSEAIEQLLELHGDRLVAVTIHAGFWSRKLSSSKQDLKNDASVALLNLLGEPLGYPAAAINRKAFDVGEGLHLNKDDWAGIINSEKELNPAIALELESQFDPNTRKLKVTVGMYQKELLEGEVRLSVMLTESDIIDAQKTPTGTVDDYVHNHVIREMFTNYTGDDVSDLLVMDELVRREYELTLDDAWVYENMELVALVHRHGTALDLIQVVGKKVDK